MQLTISPYTDDCDIYIGVAKSFHTDMSVSLNGTWVCDYLKVLIFITKLHLRKFMWI